MERRHEKWSRFYLYCITIIGTQYYDNGDKYEGQWKDDQKLGKGNNPNNKLGTMIYSNGDRYEGDWKNDLREGDGKNIQ